MKKQFFFAAVALVALASCSSEEIIGDSPTPNPSSGPEKAIVFNSGAYAITRNTMVGAIAADTLGGKFYVTGFKGDGSTMATVFDNYLVEWRVNTAGRTESNTSDWEYVGKDAPDNISRISGAQTIKYWDYSTAQYDFAAFSTGKLAAADVILGTGTETAAPAAGKVIVSGIKPNSPYGPTYSLWGDVDALRQCYISDMVTAYKDNTDTDHPYQKEVTLSFRKLTSKVRMALYETIPGYSVKSVQFYTNASTALNSTTDGDKLANATLFTPNSGEAFNTSGKYIISFPSKTAAPYGTSNYNKAHVEFTTTGLTGTTTSTTKDFGGLNYTSKDSRESVGTQFLGRTSSAPSFAGRLNPENYYKTVLPNESGADLELRVDYVLESIDGSGEEIHIYGAKAFVPKIYATWKPNFAYTYIFKISDNTNGWTSQTNTDPAGLYPITFDAIVVDSEEFEQTTITTVATPSITTYQKGHDYAADEVYDKSKGDIYAQVMIPGSLESDPYSLASDLATKGTLYKIELASGSTKDLSKVTEADVLDALNVNTGGVYPLVSPITGRNEFKLTTVTSTVSHDGTGGGTATFSTITGVDGNPIAVGNGAAVKFAAEDLTTGTYYAYVYDNTSGTPDKTYIYTAVNFGSEDSVPDDWTTNYFKDPDGKNAVAAGDFVKDGTYFYKKYTNLNRVYGVKVIKVE